VSYFYYSEAKAVSGSARCHLGMRLFQHTRTAQAEAARWHADVMGSASVRGVEDVRADLSDGFVGVGPGRVHIGRVVVERRAGNGANLLAEREFGIDGLCQICRADPGAAFAGRIGATIAGKGELAAVIALV